MYDAMQFLREHVVGDKMILGCGVPLMLLSTTDIAASTRHTFKMGFQFVEMGTRGKDRLC